MYVFHYKPQEFYEIMSNFLLLQFVLISHNGKFEYPRFYWVFCHFIHLLIQEILLNAKYYSSGRKF